MQNNNEIKDQSVLLGLLLKKEEKAESEPFCGYAKNPEILEERLWQYAEGEMDPHAEETLEAHTDTCRYCRHQLAAICQSLQAVEQEDGFSRKKVQALLARKQEARQRSLWHKIHPFFKSLELPPALLSWKPLAATLAAVLLVLLTTLYLQTQRTPSLEKAIAWANRQDLAKQVTHQQIYQAVSPDSDGVVILTPLRALLPEAGKNVPISFLNLGYNLQHIETLLLFSPLEKTLQKKVQGLTKGMKSLLKAQGAPETLSQKITLYGERIGSEHYTDDELRKWHHQIKADLVQLAGAGKYERQAAGRALELGSWLSCLKRELSLQVQGIDRQKILKEILVVEYIKTFEAYCSKYLSEVPDPAVPESLKTLSAVAAEIENNPVTLSQAKKALDALAMLIDFLID